SSPPLNEVLLAADDTGGRLVSCITPRRHQIRARFRRETSRNNRNNAGTTGEPELMSLTPADAATLRQALATVVVVPVTPLLAGGQPDWDTYAALTRRLIDGGITVITPNGNTGEFYALSHAEARQALETAARASSNSASGNRA